MDEVAARTLELLEPGAAQALEIRIVLGKVEQDGNHWIVPHGFYGPGDEVREHRVAGEDSIQATLYALHSLQVLTERLFEGRGVLSFYEDEWDIGLGKVLLPPTPGGVLPQCRSGASADCAARSPSPAKKGRSPSSVRRCTL
jgi:hypothetical protein